MARFLLLRKLRSKAGLKCLRADDIQIHAAQIDLRLGRPPSDDIHNRDPPLDYTDNRNAIRANGATRDEGARSEGVKGGDRQIAPLVGHGETAGDHDDGNWNQHRRRHYDNLRKPRGGGRENQEWCDPQPARHATSPYSVRSYFPNLIMGM